MSAHNTDNTCVINPVAACICTVTFMVTPHLTTSSCLQMPQRSHRSSQCSPFSFVDPLSILHFLKQYVWWKHIKYKYYFRKQKQGLQSVCYQKQVGGTLGSIISTGFYIKAIQGERQENEMSRNGMKVRHGVPVPARGTWSMSRKDG